MLERFTQLNGAMCMMIRRSLEFPGSVELCCRIILADYFSARLDNFLIGIAHVVFSRAKCETSR